MTGSERSSTTSPIIGPPVITAWLPGSTRAASITFNGSADGNRPGTRLCHSPIDSYVALGDTFTIEGLGDIVQSLHIEDHCPLPGEGAPRRDRAPQHVVNQKVFITDGVDVGQRDKFHPRPGGQALLYFTQQSMVLALDSQVHPLCTHGFPGSCGALQHPPASSDGEAPCPPGAAAPHSAPLMIRASQSAASFLCVGNSSTASAHHSSCLHSCQDGLPIHFPHPTSFPNQSSAGTSQLYRARRRQPAQPAIVQTQHHCSPGSHKLRPRPFQTAGDGYIMLPGKGPGSADASPVGTGNGMGKVAYSHSKKKRKTRALATMMVVASALPKRAIRSTSREWMIPVWPKPCSASTASRSPSSKSSTNHNGQHRQHLSIFTRGWSKRPP